MERTLLPDYNNRFGACQHQPNSLLEITLHWMVSDPNKHYEAEGSEAQHEQAALEQAPTPVIGSQSLP